MPLDCGEAVGPKLGIYLLKVALSQYTERIRSALDLYSFLRDRIAPLTYPGMILGGDLSRAGGLYR